MTGALGQRRRTRGIQVGDLMIGSGHPIIVQSMTNVFTHDVERCVGQIEELVNKGCELVRVSVPKKEDTAGLVAILRQVSVPVVADVHFHYERALEAIESGVAKIRLNPGNVKVRGEVEEVISACKANGTAIRVGVNQGSVIERHNQELRAQEKEQSLTRLMVDKLRSYVQIFEDAGFDNLVLSAKCHDVLSCIEVNRAVSAAFDYPLHLGLTHAGEPQTGTVRSAVALGTLLAEGIGDTIRVSLAGDPITEVEVGWEMLMSLGLRQRRGPELIACPTCGRTEIDLIGMVEEVKKALEGVEAPIKVAVMGCVVNGPGEADDADIALCGGKDKALIYCRGKRVASVPAEEGVKALLEQIRSW
ncbi:MAG: flavodoxin-dependent (E)-4-hydroxy-3-methylbut-2-enyl-diphosphate synthase [Planctomycetes bacterium]|nr:flavodoxin-dependent (E)-4-hydroxy-3-methylbut-2-enyl-diphosphate synthase [Planctomycetota bacterium]